MAHSVARDSVGPTHSTLSTPCLSHSRAARLRSVWEHLRPKLENSLDVCSYAFCSFSKRQFAFDRALKAEMEQVQISMGAPKT